MVISQMAQIVQFVGVGIIGLGGVWYLAYQYFRGLIPAVDFQSQDESAEPR